MLVGAGEEKVHHKLLRKLRYVDQQRYGSAAMAAPTSSKLIPALLSDPADPERPDLHAVVH